MSIKRVLLSLVFLVLVAGFLIPEQLLIPVESATSKDWNEQSFWYEPWGVSGVHKGIDIFADKGKALISSSPAIILFTGELTRGGKVILSIGPKWRLHYYAHLEYSAVKRWQRVKGGEQIGLVGDSGNAKGKPPHVHYSIVTLLPYIWRIDSSTQGWKKMFYLDPSELLMR
ncbi:MAG: M23 family metallopeptidase [Methylophaga sp.]|nr:M23 family metallopeptidase [Methylophaga sp.]